MLLCLRDQNPRWCHPVIHSMCNHQTDEIAGDKKKGSSRQKGNDIHLGFELSNTFTCIDSPFLKRLKLRVRVHGAQNACWVLQTDISCGTGAYPLLGMVVGWSLLIMAPVFPERINATTY